MNEKQREVFMRKNEAIGMVLNKFNPGWPIRYELIDLTYDHHMVRLEDYAELTAVLDKLLDRVISMPKNNALARISFKTIQEIGDDIDANIEKLRVLRDNVLKLKEAKYHATATTTTTETGSNVSISGSHNINTTLAAGDESDSLR